MDFQDQGSSSSSTGGRKCHPVYRSVRRRSNGRWVCEFRDPATKSRIWLGTFDTPEMAAVAYDVAVLALSSSSSPALNFPEFAHLLPRLSPPCSHQDIQRAAQQAAREFGEMAQMKEEGKGFVDEEAVFNFPALVDGMAAGMLLTPPALKKGFNWNELYVDSDDENAADFNLWNF